jgi:hypothetical protein
MPKRDRVIRAWRTKALMSFMKGRVMSRSGWGRLVSGPCSRALLGRSNGDGREMAGLWGSALGAWLAAHWVTASGTDRVDASVPPGL